jgi:hypothetical protein
MVGSQGLIPSVASSSSNKISLDAKLQTHKLRYRPCICSFKHTNTPTSHEKTITECFSFIKLVGSESISESYREVFEEKWYRGGWRRRRSESLAEDLQTPMN